MKSILTPSRKMARPTVKQLALYALARNSDAPGPVAARHAFYVLDYKTEKFEIESQSFMRVVGVSFAATVLLMSVVIWLTAAWRWQALGGPLLAGWALYQGFYGLKTKSH